MYRLFGSDHLNLNWFYNVFQTWDRDYNLREKAKL